jgi:hypothetical protein
MAPGNCLFSPSDEIPTVPYSYRNHLSAFAKSAANPGNSTHSRQCCNSKRKQYFWR